MHIKRNIRFILHKRKAGNSLKTKSVPVRMRISYAGKTIDFLTGHSVDVEFWDEKKERAKEGFNKNNQTASDINRTIDEFRSYANDIFARYELLEKRKPEPEEIRDLFNDMTGRTVIESLIKGESFYDVFDKFVQIIGEQNEWKKSTYTKFNTMKQHLLNFDSNLTFENITEEKLQGLINYLQDKANLRNTTTAKYYAHLKQFFIWAADKEYYRGKAHRTFKPRFKGTDGNEREVIHLEWDELIHLFNFQFPMNRQALSDARDVFCFCCFTGLRHSDVYKLKRSDVKENHIRIVTEKTMDGISIELNKYSRSILNKYKNIPFENDKALPVISGQKMNEHLKEIGEMAGFNEPQRIVYFKKKERIEKVYPKYELLTTHCGRRTFIVNSLYLGIPAEVIMKWTGHSDYKSMKPYIKIVDKLKKQEMGKFDSK
ncbi:MAG: site-specific integrase [Prevotellaceae bacterium]|jgi:integrase|nr:site-specific integrase [Prevotellaceae bacterium]